MHIDVARHTVRKCFQITRELGETLHFLKGICDTEEFNQYAPDIGMAIAVVQEALLNKAIKTYPSLEKEIESQIATYDRYL